MMPNDNLFDLEFPPNEAPEPRPSVLNNLRQSILDDGLDMYDAMQIQEIGPAPILTPESFQYVKGEPFSFEEAKSEKAAPFSFAEARPKSSREPFSFEEARGHDWGNKDVRDRSASKPDPKKQAEEIRAEKWFLAAEDAWAKNPLIRKFSIGEFEATQAKHLKKLIATGKMEDTPEFRELIETKELEAAEKLANYIEVRKNISSDLHRASPNFMDSLIGGLGPGIFDLINLLPVSSLANLTGRQLLKVFGQGLGYGALSAADQHQFDKSIGLATKDPLVKDLLEAGFDTALIMTAFGLLARRWGVKPGDSPKPIETTSPEPEVSAGAQAVADKIRAGAEKPKEKKPVGAVEDTGYGKILDEYKVPEEQLHTTPEPLPEVKPEFRDPSYGELDASQTQFADALKPEETTPGKLPERPLADLETPVREEPPKDFAYPELGEEFKTVRPEDAVESFGFDRPKEMRDPYQEPQGAVPNDPFIDVGAQLEDSPYLSRRLAEIATFEKEPATHGMDFESNSGSPPPKPRYRNKKLDLAAKDTPVKDEGTTPHTMSPVERARRFEGYFGDKAKFVSELYRQKNLGEVAALVDRYVPAHLLPIWDKILNSMDPETAFLIADRDNLPPQARTEFDRVNDKGESISPEGLAGYFLEEGKDLGKQWVAIRGLSRERGKGGLSVEVIAHEIYHSITKNAFRVAKQYLDGASHLGLKAVNDPKVKAAIKFYKDVNHLYNQVLKKLDPATKEIYKEQLKDIDEFATYGSTDLTFGRLLKTVQATPRKSIFQALLDAGKALLRIKTKQEGNAFDILMDINSRIDTISIDNAVMRNYWEQKKEAVARGEEVKSQPPDVTAMKLDMKDLPAQVLDDLYNIENGYDLLKYLQQHEVGDLGYAIVKRIPLAKDVVDVINQNFVTTNQLPNIFRHPVLIWGMARIPALHRQAEVRLKTYKSYLQDVIKLSRQDQLHLFKQLVDMNQAEHLQARRHAEKTNSFPKLLADLGMRADLIPHAMRVLDVMAAVHLADRNSAARVGRELPHAPGYFPISHGGKFKYKVTSKEITVVDGVAQEKEIIHGIWGYDNAVIAQKSQNEMAKIMKAAGEGYNVSPVERVDVPGMLDSIGDMLIHEALPDHIKAQVRSLERSLDTARKTFELERAGKNVSGYLGEVLSDESTLSGSFENDRLLDLLNNRIDDSYRFEVRSHIIADILQPLLWNTAFIADKPRLAHLMNHIVNREMGHDIAKTKPLDDWVQRRVDDFGKDINKIAAKALKYEASPISMLDPEFIKKAAQHTTWYTSMHVLAFNLPVFFINTLQIPMVALDGVRTSFADKTNPVMANLAFLKTQTLAFDQPALDFMKQARAEGMVEARAADLYTITETHGVKGIKATADKSINAARNSIEVGTNYTTIAYYYNHYRLNMPHLDPSSEAFKSRVYASARSWTGDYRNWSTPLIFSKLGPAGRLFSNFSKWTMNQTGRLLSDLSNIRENPTKASAYLPIISNMGIIIMLGGIFGLPGISDWEYFRQIGMQTGWFEIKPFHAAYFEMQEEAKKRGLPQAPEWMKRGLITEILNRGWGWATDGKESGPDVSGSLRHAPMVQANTVAFATIIDIAMAASKVTKYAWNAAGGGEGFTDQDTKVAIQGLPKVFQGIMNDQLIKQKRVNKETGKFEYLTQGREKDEGLYAQSEQERRMEIAGFRSVKQNEATQIRQYHMWKEREIKARHIELLDLIFQTEDLEQRKKFIAEVAANSGIEAVDRIYNYLQNRTERRITTFEERLERDAVKSASPTAQARMAEAIRRFKEDKKKRN